MRLEYIIKPYGRLLTEEEEEFHHQRILSQEVQIMKTQYLMVENDLINTFQYVYPTTLHLNVFSPQYASIIKNACSLFEVICRKTYLDLFEDKNVDIYNFLSLDKFLDFNQINIDCPLLQGEFEKDKSNILKPFEELEWDKSSQIQYYMVPKWWKAYNKIKHDFFDYNKYANLENSIRSVFALAILIYKIYGSGVVIGKADWYKIFDGEKRYYHSISMVPLVCASFRTKPPPLCIMVTAIGRMYIASIKSLLKPLNPL